MRVPQNDCAIIISGQFAVYITHIVEIVDIYELF